MKSKITKIMGVALALVLVFTVGAAFMPAKVAEAGDLFWETVATPALVGDTLVAAGENVGPVAISPNFAQDYTVFAAINVDGTTGYAVVAKSTNGGHTWSCTTTTLGAAADDPIVALTVSPSYAEDSTVFCATQTPTGGAGTGLVYRSTNGGATFSQLGVVALADDEVITSLDVSPNYDGVGVIAIGVANKTELKPLTVALGADPGSTSTATWVSETDQIETSSVLLNFVDGHTYVDLVPETADQVVADGSFVPATADKYGFWYKHSEANYGPQIELKFTDSVSGGFVDLTFMLQSAVIQDGWKEVDVATTDAFGEIGTWDGTDYVTYDTATLAGDAINALDDTYTLTRVRVELYHDYVGMPARTCYIDDITIGGTTYALESLGGREVQLWGSGDVLNWSAFGGFSEDVTSVKFSPNYAIDTTLLAVGSDDNGTYLRTRVGANAWDASIGGPAVVASGATGMGDAVTGILYGDIALPQNYDGTAPTLRRAYVSVVSEDTTVSDVYRVTNVSDGTALEVAVPLADIDYSGDYADGTLVGAVYATASGTDADVYRTTNPTAAVVNWYGCTNRPAGVSDAAGPTGWLAMAADYATSSLVIFGSDGNESAFSVSKDGAVAFNETGLIQCPDGLTDLGDMALSPDYANDGAIYLLSNWVSGGASNTALWRRTAQYGGDYWDMVHWADFAGTAGDGVIAVSNEYATDQAVYFGESGQVNVWYSGNGGDTWSARKIAAGLGVGVGTMAAPDATALYVGDNDSGTVAKSTNSGWVWPASLSQPTGAGDAIVSMKVDGSTVVVGSADGTVRRTDDGGTTWSKVAYTIADSMYVDFDGTTVYAAVSTTGQIYRSVDGGGWSKLTMPTSATVLGVAQANELILADDGTLYMGDPSTVSAITDGVWRSINPTAGEPTPGTTFEDVAGLTVDAETLALDVALAGSNILAVLIDTDATTGADTLKMYTDILSAGIAPLALVSPADDSHLTTAYAVFGIEAIPGVTAYEVWWATDPALTSRVTPLIITAPAVQVGGTVTEGYTIYWMARATAPFNSPWSEVWSFHTALITPVVAPSLVSPGSSAGSTVDVPLEPVLNWSAFKYASGYEMQMAKDSGMTDFIADMTGANALGNVTSWKCTTKLAYSTTYFWRVRAIMGTATTYSDWSNVVGFTTMAKPVAPTPPVIIEPTPPAPVLPTPTTPAYIWGIIAIGAVLVIVVVVLIVRTRRTP